LDSSYSDVGFGIANAPSYQGSGPETIVVAEYGQPASVQTAAANSSGISPVATVSGSSPTAQTINQPPSQRVSRIQVVTDGSAPWSLLAVSILATFGIAFVLIRHGLYWRRAIVRGEAFVIHHPWADTIVVGIVMIGFILSRSAGTIL
jgi:hypothetical protein